jgi:hypothetical protein
VCEHTVTIGVTPHTVKIAIGVGDVGSRIGNGFHIVTVSMHASVINKRKANV